MNLLLNSCVDEPEAPKIEVNENAQIAQVKSWFEENKTKLRLPEKGSNFRSVSQELILPFFEKEPDWDKFHHYYFPDGREVFEINLENEQVYIPTSESKEAEEEFAVRVIQNILFVKHRTENGFDPLIVRYYPDEETSKRGFKEINYQMIDEKWSGWIDLFTYDEHYFIGFQIEKGQITNTRKFTKNAPNGKFYIGKENMDVRCKIVETVWVNVTIAGDVMTITSLDSTLNQFCTVGGSESYTSGGGSYSYGGDSFPSSGGSSGSTSGYYPPDVPMPKLTIFIDYSISFNSRLNCIVGKLAMTSFVNSIAEFTKTKDVNTNSVIKLGPLNPGVNGQTRGTNGNFEITINSNYNELNRPDLLIAKTILHELVHAEILASFHSKGHTVLDNNFAANFDKFINVMYGTNNTQGDLHHKYMAENLLSTMGEALMDLHKNYFPEDFQKLNNFVKSQGYYPKGVSADFYMNLFWEGLDGTFAFNQMKSITTYPPLLSPYQKFRLDLELAKTMTKPCGD